MKSSCTNKRNFVEDLKRYWPLLLNLSVKDIKIKYRRSVLGIAWSILNPLFTMLVLTTVFKYMLRVTIPNYASYYIVGYSIWSFFAEATNLSLAAILSSASLIKKVYIPKYMFPVEKCIFALINFLFSLIAVFIVMFFQGVYPTWKTLMAVVPILLCFVFIIGFSLILSAVTVFFRDLAHIHSIVLTMWMYLTPILYDISMFQNSQDKTIKLLLTILKVNPMYYYVTYLRDVMMYNTIPGLRFNAICVAVALVFLAVGILVFKKTQSKFILYI